MVINLSGAFDTVDHPVLLAVLENRFGVSEIVLNWFYTYLRPSGFKVCMV